MQETSSQVFQTQNASRWQRFKWGGRIILFLLIIAALIIVIAVKKRVYANCSAPGAGNEKGNTGG